MYHNVDRLLDDSFRQRKTGVGWSQSQTRHRIIKGGLVALFPGQHERKETQPLTVKTNKRLATVVRIFNKLTIINWAVHCSIIFDATKS